MQSEGNIKKIFYQGHVWQADTHCPLFVKIAIFELLYLLEFEADPYETSHFVNVIW